MDLETFFTELYVLIDDYYKAEIAGKLKKHAGAEAQMSDSEVLTVMIAGQWRIGVAWRSERGILRWLEAHGRGWFPRLLKASAFNRRGRGLWQVFIGLQQWVADQLGAKQATYECIDGEPVPAFSLGQLQREDSHWLWESQEGHGGTSGGWFVGNRLLASVTDSGIITGWVLGTANVCERWLLQALLSARAGQVELVGPPPDRKHARGDLTPPVERIGPLQAAGPATDVPYIADRGFNGQRWFDHWLTHYHATVLSVPPHNAANAWPPAPQRQLATWRQIIETVFSHLADTFGLRRVDAHSYWGLYTRVAAKCAAFNIGILFNRRLGRPDLAHQTLLV